MKRKAFVRKEICRIISTDFPNLVRDKQMVVPPGMPCYRYQNDAIDMKKRYFLVINFGNCYASSFTFESIWTSDMQSDMLPPSDCHLEAGLSSPAGCLRIKFLDPEMPRDPIYPYEYIFPGSHDYWWDFGEGEADESFKPQLELILNDAIGKLRKLVLPFFEDLALYHCGLKEMSPYLMAIEDKVRVNGGWPF